MGGCAEQNMGMTVQKRRVTGLKQFGLTEFQPGSQISQRRRCTLDNCYDVDCYNLDCSSVDCCTYNVNCCAGSFYNDDFCTVDFYMIL